MDYATFRKKTQQYPLFRSNIFAHLTENVPLLRRQVSDWVKKGYVLQLKRGVYTLCHHDREADFSAYFLANQLYTPSYISLETALSHYGFIPEQVHTITSITPKKTQAFDNALGDFAYHHIKLQHYGDFVAHKDEFGHTFFMATPERAIVDFIYLRMRGIQDIQADVFTASFRFQHLQRLRKNKLKAICKKFNQKKLTLLVNILIDEIRSL
jgi:predicted transcriptional regulator of viral defense system